MTEGDGQLYQIELNTISASLAGLSTNLANLRRAQFSGVPENQASTRLARGMKRAVEVYCREFDAPSAAVLFVVHRQGERNVLDQQALADALTAAGIAVLRRPLCDASLQVDDQGRLVVDGQEIGLVYYRAGYAPSEYVNDVVWRGRELLESSRAIKCPDIAAHLAGLKKIQQVLTDEQCLTRVMRRDAAKAHSLRACFAKIASLDPADPETATAIQAAAAQPDSFVLKPQREGGGNNFYGQNILTAFQSMSPQQLSAYILMQRIRPTVTPNTPVLRNGQQTVIDAVSELGIYGYILAVGDQVIENETCGWLLRTKSADSDEGGLISGYSFLDCPYLS